MLLKRPPQAQADNRQPSPRIPFEVKTERVAPTRSLLPPAGKRDSKPSVERKELPPYQPIPQHVDPPAPLATASAPPPPVTTAPRSEPAKATIQTTAERVDPPVPLPVASTSPPPAVAAPKSEPAKPVTQAIPERIDPPAPRASASPSPAIAAPRIQPAKPREEAYVAPVLISQQGARVPRELLPILTCPVAVSVRVEVNEAGRVTHAEAIPEGHPRTVAECRNGCRAALPFSAGPPGAIASPEHCDHGVSYRPGNAIDHNNLKFTSTVAITGTGFPSFMPGLKRHFPTASSAF